MQIATAKREPEEETVRLNVSTDLRRKPIFPEATHHTPIFRIKTTIAAPLGDYIVLAATPGRTDSGEAIALVVRVTELDRPR